MMKIADVASGRIGIELLLRRTLHRSVTLFNFFKLHELSSCTYS
jgi:hypothetical protein